VAGLGFSGNLPDAMDGTYHFDFLLSGVPNLVANQDAAPYLPGLPRGVAGECGHRHRAGLTRAEVQKLIVDTKLDVQMKAFGQ
jgi:hypothetical protein